MKAKRTVKKHCKKRGGYKPPRSKRRKRTRQRKRIKKQSGGDLPPWLGIIGLLLLASGGFYWFIRNPERTIKVLLQRADDKGDAKIAEILDPRSGKWFNTSKDNGFEFDNTCTVINFATDAFVSVGDILGGTITKVRPYTKARVDDAVRAGPELDDTTKASRRGPAKQRHEDLKRLSKEEKANGQTQYVSTGTELQSALNDIEYVESRTLIGVAEITYIPGNPEGSGDERQQELRGKVAAAASKKPPQTMREDRDQPNITEVGNFPQPGED